MSQAYEIRPIPGYPNYVVSTTGLVWNVATSKLLRANKPNTYGYLRVRIRNDEGVFKTIYIHRLVLAAFVGPLPEGAHSRHLDGNPLNNHLSNLTYGSPQENAADRRKHGRAYEGTRHLNAQKTHCKWGHEFNTENTYVLNNQRYCRACGRRRAKEIAERRGNNF